MRQARRRLLLLELGLLLVGCGHQSPAAPLSSGASPAVAIDAVRVLQLMPTDYQHRLVEYAVIDRPNDGGGTIRHAYVNREALAVVQQGTELPSGTVIVMEQYLAKRGSDGALLQDSQGKLVIDHLDKLLVRAKLPAGETVAGDQLPASLRNGQWVYATFDPANRQRDSLNATVCNACHQQAKSSDYLFTQSDLTVASQQHIPHYSLCELSGRQSCARPRP